MSILTMNVEGMSYYIRMLCKYLKRKIQHIHKGNVQQGVSDIGHWQFSCYICDKSQTQMCPIFLTESMDMRQINSNSTEWGACKMK